MTTDIRTKTTAFAVEGYLTLGDIRRIVEATAKFDDAARVEAGMEDEGNVTTFDMFAVEDLTERVPDPTERE